MLTHRPRRKGKRQRFYARNALKTTLDPRSLRDCLPGRLMRSFLASPANSYYPNRIHPALTSFADECLRHAGAPDLPMWGRWRCLPSSASIYGTNCLKSPTPSRPRRRAGARPARSQPAFAVSQIDSSDKTESYEILRHPEGGRKDVLRWGPPAYGRSPSSKSIVPAANRASRQPAMAEIAARMGPGRPTRARGGRCHRQQIRHT